MGFLRRGSANVGKGVDIKNHLRKAIAGEGQKIEKRTKSFRLELHMKKG
jgi:hypothetical protein